MVQSKYSSSFPPSSSFKVSRFSLPISGLFFRREYHFKCQMFASRQVTDLPSTRMFTCQAHSQLIPSTTVITNTHLSTGTSFVLFSKNSRTNQVILQKQRPNLKLPLPLHPSQLQSARQPLPRSRYLRLPMLLTAKKSAAIMSRLVPLPMPKSPQRRSQRLRRLSRSPLPARRRSPSLSH